MTVTATVYDPTNTTEVTPGGLVKSHARRWQDRFSEPGGASLRLQNTDAQRAECSWGRIIRYAIDGSPRFAALIEAKSVVSAAAGEEKDQVTEVKGRGTMARWEDFVVYPMQPLGSQPFSDVRAFDYTSFDLDDSAWTAAVVTPDTTDGGVNDNYGNAVGWPDSTAEWIWDRDSGGGIPGTNVPAGDVYLRHEFVVATDGIAEIWAAADDAYEVYVDGVRMAEDGPLYVGRPRNVQFFLTAGTHLIAAKATNQGLKGGFLCTLMQVNGDGSLGAVLTNSGADWLCLGYPAAPPGFSPRRVLEILLSEAQARGAVPELTLGGTTAADVDLTPWPETPDISFRVGLDGLAVLRQLAESYIDCAMDPTSMRLDVWVHGGKGSPSGVVYALGEGITEGMHDATRPEVTATLLRWAGGWQDDEDAALVAANGRREGFLSTGDAQSTAESDRVAGVLMARMGVGTEKITIAIDRGADVPYVDWQPGDTVGAPDHLGVATTWRARGVTVSEDAEGNPFYAPELETP